MLLLLLVLLLQLLSLLLVLLLHLLCPGRRGILFRQALMLLVLLLLELLPLLVLLRREFLGLLLIFLVGLLVPSLGRLVTLRRREFLRMDGVRVLASSASSSGAIGRRVIRRTRFPGWRNSLLLETSRPRRCGDGWLAMIRRSAQLRVRAGRLFVSNLI